MAHLINANSMRIGGTQDGCDIGFGQKLIYTEFYIRVYVGDIY